MTLLPVMRAFFLLKITSNIRRVGICPRTTLHKAITLGLDTIELSYLIRDRLLCLTGNFFDLDDVLSFELELKRLRNGDRLYVDTNQSLE
jgi:hypothetical protein